MQPEPKFKLYDHISYNGYEVVVMEINKVFGGDGIFKGYQYVVENSVGHQFNVPEEWLDKKKDFFTIGDEIAFRINTDGSSSYNNLTKNSGWVNAAEI